MAWYDSLSAGVCSQFAGNTVDDVQNKYSKTPGNNASVMAAWSGGTLVYISGEPYLAVMGGGHTDGWDNTVFLIPLGDVTTPGWFKGVGSYSSSGDTVYNDANGIWADGRPSPPHTYGKIAFSSTLGAFVLVGQSAWWSAAASSGRQMHAYDLSGEAWLQTGGASDLPLHTDVGGSLSGCVVRNPATDQFIYIDSGTANLLRLQASTASSWTQNDTGVSIDNGDQTSWCYDTLRDRIVGFGDGIARKVEGAFYLPRPCVPQDISDSGVAGGTAMQSAAAPGFVYCEDIDRYIAWNGGLTLYFLHPETFVWTSTTYTGDNPGSAQTNGTFGRFQYVPERQCCVVVNSTTGGTYAFPIDVGSYPTPKVSTGTVLFTQHAALGGNGWTNGGNLLVNDTNVATPQNASSRHRLYNPNLPAIPSGATNIGWQVYFNYVNDSYGDDTSTAGATFGPDGTNWYPSSLIGGVAAPYGGGAISFALGGSSYDGGHTYTASEANGDGMSVQIGISSSDGYSEETQVRSVWLRGYYTAETATTVGNSLDLRWSLQAYTGQSLDMRWQLAEYVQQSADLRWQLFEFVQQSLDTRWALAEYVQQSADLRWQLAEYVQQSLDLRWAVAATLSAVGNSLDLRWQLAEYVQQSADMRWQLAEYVQQSADLRWQLLEFVQQQTDVRWQLFEYVSQSLDSRWALAEYVQQSLDLRWALLQAGIVGNSLDLRWSLNAFVQQQTDLRWQLLEFVQQQADLRWQLLQAAGNSLDLRWQLAEYVAQQADVRWALQAFVGNQLDLRWRIGDAPPRITGITFTRGAPATVFTPVFPSTTFNKT